VGEILEVVNYRLSVAGVLVSFADGQVAFLSNELISSLHTELHYCKSLPDSKMARGIFLLKKIPPLIQ